MTKPSSYGKYRSGTKKLKDTTQKEKMVVCKCEQLASTYN
nr:unnamed protein product [Callosobruchus analis]